MLQKDLTIGDVHEECRKHVQCEEPCPYYDTEFDECRFTTYPSDWVFD